MVNTSNRTSSDNDLQEVANGHNSATAALAKLARALDSMPLLSAEITRLRRRLASTIRDLHNLIAAARATLNANADGEQDPLFYLRDEQFSRSSAYRADMTPSRLHASAVC